MIRPVQCLVVECDDCGQPLDDFSVTGEDRDYSDLLHFNTALEVVVHLGGTYEGRMYTGTGRSGGVLMPGGVFYCYVCKLKPHDHAPGELVAAICGRCGALEESHTQQTTADADFEPARAVPGVRPRGVAPRDGSCTVDCSDLHQYPVGGLAEPDDGARIEFVYATDRYAAWRDVESTILAGWPADMSWTVYPASTGHTWECMQRTFGPALNGAILLSPTGVLKAAASG